MDNFDIIKPVFNVSDKDNNLIKQINDKLSKININSENKRKNLRIKSKVRSIHSSLAIEANSLALEAVSDIINDKMVLGKRKEIQEVKNANELYDRIHEFNWRSEEDLLKAHTIMMKYFDDDNGGYRTHGEGVKKGDEVIFIAPDSLLIKGLMDSLFKFINDFEKKINPLVLASIFHYYFVYIHPFTDGNGRIARFWISLMLTDYNCNFEYIPIEEAMYLKQEEYYNSIAQCHNNGNANVFISFMLEAINYSLEKTTQKTTQIKLNKTQLKMIELIKNNSFITRKEMAKELNMSEDGVKYNLNKLSNHDIIKRIGSDNGGYWNVQS